MTVQPSGGAVQILLQQGAALAQAKRFEEALAAYDRAATLRSDDCETFFNRGVVLRALERREEAIASYDRALAIRPAYPQALSNRGLTLRELKRFDEAVASFDQAIALKPDYAAAWYNRGNALAEDGRPAEALASYDRARALAPQARDIEDARGLALLDLDRPDEALAAFDRAIALRPDMAESHSHRGEALHVLGRFDEALESFDRAIAIRPGFTPPLGARSFTLLLLGRLAEGWRDYEFVRRSTAGPEGMRRWRGEPLDGGRLLIQGEQGLGDTLQFARYAQRLAADGARVTLSVQPPLKSLLARSAPRVSVIAVDEPAPAADWYCPLLSMPLAVGTTLETIPAASRYLTPDPERRARVEAELGARTKPRVGLVWSGNPDHKNDRNRSMLFAEAEGLLGDACDWSAIQKDLRPAEADAVLACPRLAWRGPALGDFDDAAALVDAMDLVITVDTSIAHLAGALGTPVWILLPHSPDFRWLLGRTDSPWYPSARLFRQASPGDWAGVVREIRTALRAEFGG
jgi:tetratricopeptide (TPR) repeat protein